MFLTLLSNDGGPVCSADRTEYARRMRALAGAEPVTVEEGAFYALVAPAMVPLRPLIARRRGLVGIGNVRLDNREEVRLWGDAVDRGASDLELVLEAYQARGARCIPGILGDFAFVIYDSWARTLLAGRDAFGVRTLFIGKRPRVVVLSSHLEPVHDQDHLDEEFVADFLLGGDPGPERTIWADSRAVPQGSILTAEGVRVAIEQFWTPYSFEPRGGDERGQVEQFRELFREAVRLRMAPHERTWAELSGGLDSSSVVSTAQTLAREGVIDQGMAGTLSLVDELGEGDERRFSECVVAAFGLRSDKIMNCWPWEDDGERPPCTDEPRAHYAYFARDRRISTTVRRAGARVLLTGIGSDHYLSGNRLFFADLVSAGHLVRAAKQLTEWAIGERCSVWRLVAQNVLLPLVPEIVERGLQPGPDRVPPWINRRFARRHGLAKRASSRAPSPPTRLRFSRRVGSDLASLTRWLGRGPFDEGMEQRHPFLDRRLVEFSLQLPVSMRVRPQATKWILREAMRGILPEEVRTRSGKGGIDARVTWALAEERVRIREILQDPVLGQIGCVSPARLESAVVQAAHGECDNTLRLLAVLSLETWLFVRSGRWIVRGLQPFRATKPPHAGLPVHLEGGESYEQDRL